MKANTERVMYLRINLDTTYALFNFFMLYGITGFCL